MRVAQLELALEKLALHMGAQLNILIEQSNRQRGRARNRTRRYAAMIEGWLRGVRAVLPPAATQEHPAGSETAIRETAVTWLKEHKKAWSGYDLFSLIRIMRPGSPRKVGEDGEHSEIREAHWQEFLEARGVETPCKKCGGLGTAVYGSTATWQGGIGGAAMTNGICDRCWGSGDENKHWTNLRTLLLPSRQGAAKRVEG